MKKIPFVIIAIILMNIGLVAFAQDNTPYNNEDINTLKNIFHETQNNADILDWDITNPSSINEAEWKKKDDEYYLYFLDLSNLTIDGDINLTNCLYLEECNFSNTDINSVQLPCSLKNISNKSFENCSKLQVITINADDTVIGSNACSGCISLKSIVNAERITSIGRNAFNNCENLNFCFSENNSNPYIENYVQQHDFNIFNSVITNAYGYAGMINYKYDLRYDLSEYQNPYYIGNVSLYTVDKEYIETVNVDRTGKFLFNNVKIGEKYKIVIDGKTAIPREEFFVAVSSDYCIAPESNCFAIMVCDYNRDGIFNSLDLLEFNSKNNKSVLSSAENIVFDFNGDGHVNTLDKSVLNGLYAQKKDRYTYN